jgi:hypothetical protein
MGIMFLVFIPTPYVDASSAWAFPAAGSACSSARADDVELFLAAIAAFCVLNTSPACRLGLPINELAATRS